MSNKNTLKFCITHDVPLYKIDDETVIIWLGEGKGYENLKNHVVVVRNVYPDLDFYRPYLMGTAGVIAVRRMLSTLGGGSMDTLVCLKSYRKIVANVPLGVESATYPGMRVADPALPYDPGWCLSRGDYLFSQPIIIGRCMTQYASAHKFEDFLRYVALALELGVLTDGSDAEQFMLNDVLIPGGVELGVFPYNVIMKIGSDLEMVAMEYCQRHRPVDVGLYNRRAVSFCSERMGSYLLLKQMAHMNSSDALAESVGYMTLFSPEREYLANDM